jgi:hypothetical protein
MVGATFTVAATGVVIRGQRTLTALGNAQVDTAQYKFGGSALLCDGTGDYLMSPMGSQWEFGTSSFTIEYWIRFNAINTLYVPICLRTAGGNIFNGEWWCEITAAENKMYWGFKNIAGTQYYVNLALAGTAFATGQFYHIALVNNAGTAQMYINGTATGATTALSGSFGGNGTNLNIGAYQGLYSVNGWIDEVRISTSARYTANFTPSTTAFVNDATTLLLVHANGTDATTVFEDDNGIGRSQAAIYRENGPVISTAQSKFGGSSLYFNESSGQAINVGYDTIAQGLTNNGDFTIEFWAYFTKTPNLGDTGYMMMYSHNPEPYLLFQANNLALGAGGYPNFIRAGSANWSTNTWYHIAVSRSSGNLRVFENGTQIGSTVTGSTYNFIPYTDNLFTRLGKFGDDRGRWQGYMDEIRFSKTARYTANFTAPTQPFVNDSNTLFLIHGDGTNNSTVFRDDNAQLSVIPAAASVNEGSSLTFNVSTINTQDQTLYYSLTNAGDFATSSGSFSLTSNAGSFSVTPTADTTTEGAETFTAQIRTGSTSGPIIATSSAVTINDTSVASIVVNSAFTDDSSTKILLHFENNVVDDNSSGRTAVATQTLYDSGAFRTDQKKFGSYSVGGTGIPGGWSTNNPTALNPGTGDFTIEFWFRPCATANSDQITMASQSTGSVHIFIAADNGFIGFGKQNISWDVQTTAGAISVAWHHFAVTRSGTTLRLYLDGTVRDTVTGNTDNYTSNVWSFSMGGIAGTYFHMDEFRISSIARYTSNFTVA